MPHKKPAPPEVPAPAPPKGIRNTPGCVPTDTNPAIETRELAIQEIVRLLNGMFQDVDLFSRKALRKFGVTGPQIWALQTIAGAENLAMGSLARKLYLHPSTVSGIVDRLESHGFVTRHRHAEDTRVVMLRLTSMGIAVLKRAPQPPRSKVAQGLERLPSGKLDTVLDAIRTLGHIMEVPTPGKESTS